MFMSGFAFQVYKKYRDICRGYAGDSGCLADGYRSVSLQFLTCFNAEASYIFIINVFRNFFLLQFFELLHLFHLAADIAIIFDVDLYLLTYIFWKFRSFLINRCKHFIVKFRSADQLCQRGS